MTHEEAPCLAEIQVFRAEISAGCSQITRSKSGEEVKLVCSNEDASIYYTTDGKGPQPGVSPFVTSRLFRQTVIGLLKR